MTYAKVKENFKGKIHQLFCKQENRDGGNQSKWKIVFTTVWNSSNIYLPQVYNIHGTAQAENIFPVGIGGFSAHSVLKHHFAIRSHACKLCFALMTIFDGLHYM